MLKLKMKLEKLIETCLTDEEGRTNLEVSENDKKNSCADDAEVDSDKDVEGFPKN